MGIDVRYATTDDRDRWNNLVEQSPHATPFHLLEFCETAADHSGTEFHPLVGYKGQEPVGIFPTFELNRGPLTAVVSPPPDLKINYHGPAMVNVAKLKQRKAERRHQRFVDGCLDLLEDDLDPSYVHVRTSSRYTDSRPFRWREFEISPSYTYVVDLDVDEDELLGRFSSDARQNIRGEYDGVEISEGGRREARRIIRQVVERHEEQDEPFHVTPEFVSELTTVTPDGTVRPYVCRVDGEFAGGMVALELGDTIYRWLGGAKTDGDVPVNDLVDWHIMRDAMSRGVTRCDLVGAQNKRISRYKAKFAPEIELYQQLECGTFTMRLASKLYRQVRK